MFRSDFMFRFGWILGLLFCIGGAASGNDESDDDAKLEFFETRIRPVLVKHCYECHSAKSKEVKGSLLVDSAEGLIKGGDSGAALVPGRPDESPLIEALRFEGFEMPPAGRLPKKVVDDFVRWIEMGAPDPRMGPVAEVASHAIDIEEGRKFWAFQPIQTPPAPAVKDSSWLRSPIDAFVLAKLEQNGLTPSPDTDRATLLRRLHYDLIGLPPTPEELAAFVSDKSPNAISAVVDKLLDSAQFGVHWGRHWLDVARYADSNGGDFNATFHNAWRYRDYVVSAMNDDKPFDQFVREQIAGDLLPYENDDQRTEQMIATGFLMVGTKMLSERDKEKLRMDVVDEQINSLGKAFMGLTLGCARCHDHKFDPVPTEDYYSLAGIFRSTSTLEGESQQYVSTWPRRALPAAPEHVAKVKKHEQEQKEVKATLDATKKELASAQTRFDQLTANENALTIDDTDAKLTGEWKHSTYSKGYIGKGYLHDDQTEKGKKSVEFSLKIPKSGRYDVRLAYTGAKGRDNNVPVTIRHAEGETKATLDQEPPPPIGRVFASVGQFRFEAGAIATVTISNHGTTGYVIADAAQLVEVDKNGVPVVVKNRPEKAELSEAQAALTELNTQVAQLDSRLQELTKNAPAPLPKAIAVVDHKEIGDCEIRIRGEPRNLGPKVDRGFLQVAVRGERPIFPKDESGRRELAEWIAGPDHPLTPRVIVNRIWCHLIGDGIVRTVDNFGTLGERPTHPALLDHLASDFVRDGWSIKRAVRRIVLSRTYQMSSEHDEPAWQADPDNRWLWRAHRRRLPAESIRDSLLVMSGKLDLQPGGSPVEGLGTLVTTNSSDAKQYEREETFARSIYLPIIRNELPAILTVFDFANPDLVTGKRSTTNVPAQALLLMNSPFVMDCADATAKRLIAAEPADDQELVARLYLLTLARRPTTEEADRAIAFLQSDETAEKATRLARLVHVLFGSTEFRIRM